MHLNDGGFNTPLYGLIVPWGSNHSVISLLKATLKEFIHKCYAIFESDQYATSITPC